MIKKILLLFVIAFGIVSCNHDDNTIDYTKYYSWRDQNNLLMMRLTEYQKKLGSAAYFYDTIPSIQEPLSYNCFVRVIQSANEDSLRKINKWYTPFYTSTLKMHYTLYDSKSVLKKLPNDEATFNNASFMDDIFFDSSNKADTIESKQVEYFENFTPSSVITGWGDILQHMHIGDNWLVCIPWYLAYGQSGNSSIDPYTDLFFRMELVDITSWGHTPTNN